MATAILTPLELPAGLFSGPFRAETEKQLSQPGTPRVFPVLELALPGGTRLLCKDSYPSDVRGNYLPLVSKFGRVARSVDERQNQIVAVTAEPEIYDYDRSFEQELQTRRGTLRGSAAVIRLLSPSVSDADSFTAFSGVLDNYEQVQPFVWKLSLRPNDAALRYGQVPRFAIIDPDFPNMDATARGQFIPTLRGVHTSDSLTNKGMVPTLYVDTVNFYYVLSLGRIKGLRTVYKDGTALSSGYSLVYLVVNGKVLSAIKFTGTQGSSAITADVDGLTDRADGTGDVITNPAYQFRHFLANEVFGEWRGDTYVDPATAPIEPASFAFTADFFNALGHEGSKRYGGTTQMRAEDAVNEWLDSHEMKAFWTNDGRLAVKPLDHRARLLYRDDQWLHSSDVAGLPSAPYNAQAILRRLVVQYLYGSVDSKYFQQLNVFDGSVTALVGPQTRSLAWSAARLT